MSALDLSTPSKNDPDLQRLASGWRLFCLSPNSQLLQQAVAVVRACLPAATILEIPEYAPTTHLEKALDAQAPNILLLDLISDRERALSLMSDVVNLGPKVNILVLLEANEPQLILRCLRHGAAEFLLQPFTREQLEASLAKISRSLPRDVPKYTARVICFMPAKGACGASTLATNLAFHAKRNGVGKVLLADMDPWTGTVSFLLNAKSSYNFLDVLTHLDDLDADMWKAMVTNRQGIDVLLSPDTLTDGVNDLRDAAGVLEFARANYDVVVLDSPNVYGDWSLSQARLCDEIILTTTNELPAIQATQRALTYLETNRVGRRKIRVVVNRYDKEIGLSREAIGEALHTDVFHVIPSDYESVQKALLEGKPFTASSKVGKAFATLGDRLTGKPKPAPKSSSPFGGLLSLFSRTSS
jgi:pilus assembly protein CpaE